MTPNWIALKRNTIGPVISTQTARFGSKPKTGVILLSIALIEVTYFHSGREKPDATVVMSDHVLSIEPGEGGTGGEWGGGSDLWIIKISVDIDLIFSYCQGEI